MAEVVYFLCAVTSALCSVTLFCAYRRNRVRLLLWSSLCFFGFVLNNLLLFLDVIILPEVDLSTWRILPAFVGIVILIYGLIWDSP
jgi:hypothetical protein